MYCALHALMYRAENEVNVTQSAVEYISGHTYPCYVMLPSSVASSQWPLPSVGLFCLPSSQPPPQSCKWCQVGGRSECGRCHCRQVGWHWWSHLVWSGTQWRSSTWGSQLTRWHSKWWLSCWPGSGRRGPVTSAAVKQMSTTWSVTTRANW